MDTVSESYPVIDVLAYLHHAVCIGMVMDRAAFSRAPNKNKLEDPLSAYTSCMTSPTKMV